MSTERWRLILGRAADPTAEQRLEGEKAAMDRVLEALYDTDRQGGLGRSSPNLNRWLGDIRRYFPTPVVQLMQREYDSFAATTEVCSISVVSQVAAKPRGIGKIVLYP